MKSAIFIDHQLFYYLIRIIPLKVTYLGYIMTFTFICGGNQDIKDIIPPVVCRRAHVLLMLCLFAYSDVQYIWTIWVTWQVSYKKQELLYLRAHLVSSPVFHLGLRSLSLYTSIIFYLPILSFVLCCHCLRVYHSWLPLCFLQHLFIIIESFVQLLACKLQCNSTSWGHSHQRLPTLSGQISNTQAERW